eukprot:CAMPEP_0171216418 /NCGR_PEP_ID=MMETSP0790-20130122/32171_1 /TAXON_ID=2925 /ORGANISM="Alexandrium catenella, Strain OF101" /LENGTH=114 /DNA_ID=CAMNT_0011682199 /DNA_START=60 /DNA_END=404 /DNA_ORIENTATION=+
MAVLRTFAAFATLALVAADLQVARSGAEQAEASDSRELSARISSLAGKELARRFGLLAKRRASVGRLLGRLRAEERAAEVASRTLLSSQRKKMEALQASMDEHFQNVDTLFAVQ